jgi:16S rRNA (guanine527-N7)-methyltransferase
MIDVRELERKASELGLHPSAAQLDQLVRYAALLLKWNKVYNLTRITADRELLDLHLVDSLTLVKAVREMEIPLNRILDVGSGGGLPAIPFAIMQPEVSVTMVDAVKKKAMFLTQVCVELGLSNATAVHGRVEDVKVEPVDAISSRAFASLSDMCALTRHLLRAEGLWLAMKGKMPQEEIDALGDGINVSRIMKLTIPGASLERHLIVLKQSQGTTKDA